jgi:hypothetical protein
MAKSPVPSSFQQIKLLWYAAKNDGVRTNDYLVDIHSTATTTCAECGQAYSI